MKFFDNQKIFVIAEAGKNFIVSDHPTVTQCLNEAQNLARLAKSAGADAIKFQTHVLEDEQQKRDSIRHDWIRLNESVTPYQGFWRELKEYCDSIGILFITTPMSRMAAQQMNDLVTVWKVSSADITDAALLGYLAETKKPVIISSGMSSKSEVEAAADFLMEREVEVAILHCTSIYPCPVNKLNLNVIRALKKTFPRNVVGFSDHSMSLTIPKLAIECGARIIEKHFTIENYADGPDHKISLSYAAFCQMVSGIRIQEERLFAFGNGIKEIYPEEQDIRSIFRHDK